MARKLVREGTFVLNPSHASLDTYQTWVTIRLWSDGSLERKCNELRSAGDTFGAAQTWNVFGYVSSGTVRLFTTNAIETRAARTFAHVVKELGRKCNVGGYGAAWRNATWLRPTRNARTGRKLTAAPSIRDGRPPRDKNVNRMRERVANIDMAAAMEARRAARK